MKSRTCGSLAMGVLGFGKYNRPSPGAKPRKMDTAYETDDAGKKEPYNCSCQLSSNLTALALESIALGRAASLYSGVQLSVMNKVKQMMYSA